MAIHNEKEFENDICEHLASHGWDYSENDEAYDAQLALVPQDLADWVKAAYPEAWQTLEKTHGSKAPDALAKRLRASLDQQGTLECLRGGIDVLGLKHKLKLAQFKPAMGMNDDIVNRYQANRLRVMRQVHYSVRNKNSIDLVLFLNGIPIATVELKTNNTQTIEDAVTQYKHDRNPGKGVNAEPLLSFPSRALVHFAVSSSQVKMSTKLDGYKTTFLPFNLGDGGASGNPLNPNGHQTSYLWETVWQRDSLLEIIGRYMVNERDEKKHISKVIFPRFHQLDATRKLQAAILEEGPGKKYLIQHSAGSGKTNSIAWSAHFLADLHDQQDRKVFDSVIVVSDRNVIDSQLQEVIDSFERNAGVVATIKSGSGSKSAQLAEALSGDKKVVVCTIQTFPFAMEEVQRLAATEGKQFAVIADEAHSSQTGQAASKLKQVLTAEQQAELADGEEISTEDLLALQMESRAAEDGITYVAFTATPKAKTLELFGRVPNELEPPGEGNLPAPFHVYSMRQAIEEGFILDVLTNYTTYTLAFKLATGGQDVESAEVEKGEALKSLMGWVKLHPHNIAQKVQIVVEHYRSTVASLLDGKAKAMVVVGSRLEAVRWQLAIEKYISEKQYGIKSLVAFSGEVDDPETSAEPLKEHSKVLNPGLNNRDIREAFKEDDFRILLVANKFQTGFDQPLLCGMYVDKRLAGIQAVQTLSRLNRCYPGKEEPYVLDFANEPEEILAAFQTYYATAELSDTSDKEMILDLRAKLDALGLYDEYEIDTVVKAVVNSDSKQKEYDAAITPVADRLLKRYSKARQDRVHAQSAGDEKSEKAAKETMDMLVLFKKDIQTYIRAYTFLSQMVNYQNTDYEKRAIFYRALVRLLKFGRERDGVDLSELQLTHHLLRSNGMSHLRLIEDDEDSPKLQPLGGGGTGEVRDPEKLRLAEIIEKVNELFEGELTDDDKLVYVDQVLKSKLLESKLLQKQASSNTKEQFAGSPDLYSEQQKAIMGAMDAHKNMGAQALASKAIQAKLIELLLSHSSLYEDLRARAQAV